MTPRQSEITNWVATLFPNLDLSTLHYIQADASNRKYLRLQTNNISFIIMDTQPGQEMLRFIKIAQILATNKLNVPTIIDFNSNLGLILMSDLGTDTYLSALEKNDNTNKLYIDAISTLANMQQLSKEHTCELPKMDSKYIKSKLQVFNEWYIQKHLKTTISNALLIKLEDLFNETFKKQPQVFVHLDYHSRNLMVQEKNNPGILDFQDAMYGPITYDLVSFLEDAYITLTDIEVKKWFDSFTQIAGISEVSLKDFYIVGLQRHLKNLGVFARLHYRDGKSGYLESIPTLLNYINATCIRYPEIGNILESIVPEGLALSSPNE